MAEDARMQGLMAAEDGASHCRAGAYGRGRRAAPGSDGHVGFSSELRQGFQVRLQERLQVRNAEDLDAEHGLHAHEGSPMVWTKRQQQWQDPADSVYELAAQAFQRQDYARAATKFAEMIAKFPNSRRISQASYYQAFSLYRADARRTSQRRESARGKRPAVPVQQQLAVPQRCAGPPGARSSGDSQTETSPC